MAAWTIFNESLMKRVSVLTDPFSKLGTLEKIKWLTLLIQSLIKRVG